MGVYNKAYFVQGTISVPPAAVMLSLPQQSGPQTDSQGAVVVNSVLLNEAATEKSVDR